MTSPTAHNIQAGGHQILRVCSTNASNLIKPVGRDAVVAMHMILSGSEDEASSSPSLPNLSFLRPFVPATFGARFSGVVAGEGNALTDTDLDAFKALQKWRGEGARQQFPNGASFQAYFEACRDVLKAKEAALQPFKTKDESSSSSDAPSAESPSTTAAPTAVPTTVAETKKPRLTSAKPWELVMKNLTSGMVSPQVLDLKLGRMKTQPGAERAAEKEAKDEGTTAKSVGVRIAGLHVTCGDPAAAAATAESTEISVGDQSRKPFSDLLPAGWERASVKSRERLRDVLKVYLSDIVVKSENHSEAAKEVFLGAGDSPSEVKVTFLRPLALKILSEIRPIVSAFQENKRWFAENLSILSSSVLFIYDAADWDAFAAGEGSDADGATLAQMRTTVVRLIDFDRTGPRAEHYSEEEIQYIPALVTIAELLDELVKSS